jgi:hypothetical protein
VTRDPFFTTPRCAGFIWERILQDEAFHPAPKINSMNKEYS